MTLLLFVWFSVVRMADGFFERMRILTLLVFEALEFCFGKKLKVLKYAAGHNEAQRFCVWLVAWLSN